MCGETKDGWAFTGTIQVAKTLAPAETAMIFMAHLKRSCEINPSALEQFRDASIGFVRKLYSHCVTRAIA